MNNMMRFDTIEQYNTWMGTETLHPLVSVIDFGKSGHKDMPDRMYFGFYVIFLKDIKCGNLRYGRQYYDYQEGTIVCLAPGQVLGIEKTSDEMPKPKGKALVFHPDLLHGTALGHRMKDYTFFSYEVNEALHLSERERQVIDTCLERIREELEHPVDRHSKTLITDSIGLFLDYCVRFYERQFITREKQNRDVISRFEEIVNNFYDVVPEKAVGQLLTVKYCADHLNLSPNYFGDLIKRETGLSARDAIRKRLMDIAKARLCDDSKSISEIAYELGFSYPQHFSRIFKQETGLTPLEYRRQTV